MFKSLFCYFLFAAWYKTMILPKLAVNVVYFVQNVLKKLCLVCGNGDGFVVVTDVCTYIRTFVSFVGGFR